MSIKVALRNKPISGGRKTLYLDFYPPILNPETGKLTRREFLGLYIYNETIKKKQGKDKPVKLNPIDKQHNEDTLNTAELIRQKRQNQLNKPEIYTGEELEKLRIKELSERNFVEYFKSLADKRKASNFDNWVSAYKYLEIFTKGILKFADLNEKFCTEFKEYLLTTKSNKSNKVTLSQNSAVSYFNKFKASMKQAYKDGYLQTNLNVKINTIKTVETQREYLSIEQVQILVKTPCSISLLKSSALFSILTGLRFSDIAKLVWSEVQHSEIEGYFLKFIQQKTKAVENLPISEQAFSLMGERKEPKEQVFKGLVYSAYLNSHLKQWILNAGITEKITFHSFRHTYATLQLSKGTDIYTVSKMLGHRELKTTQIYAKIIDKTKREATDKIKLDL